MSRAELARWARNAQLPDVENLLASDALSSAGDNIRAFATLLGRTLGKRQSIDAPIQTILSYLDGARLHRVISQGYSQATGAEENKSVPGDQGPESASEDDSETGPR